MKISVIAVGKLKNAGLRELSDDYKRRVRRYVDLQELEVKNDSALEKALTSRTFVVALEVGGQALTSTEFSKTLFGWIEQGAGDLGFIVGGAEGIPKALSRRARARLSLSRMTLPHRLARVMLFEQIYRAVSIRHNQPYARED